MLPPLSLYVHIPWCVKKCPYCDFNSHAAQGALPEADYLAALLQDLPGEIKRAQGRRLESIFFGGGTPSLLSAQFFNALLTQLQKQLEFSPDIEITLEANPGTAELCNFTLLAQVGVNRISLGVQSFNDRHLQQLGRIHSAAEVPQAVAKIRAAGIDNINLDLMHGLPGQTLDEARADLTAAIALAPQHISWYQLTIEPNTIFYNRPPVLPEDDLLADIQAMGEDVLAAAGYAQYEVSAFAKPKKEAAHNINYWQFGDYLALGAGAHGKITWPDRLERYAKTRLPKDYLAATQFDASVNIVADEQKPFEFMMNGLRLRAGIPRQFWIERCGLPDKVLTPMVDKLIKQGLLEADDDFYRTTALGYRFLNTVLQEFE
ncbi:MAG TPA: radical SAM family heme chaperone HemW [Cellvibrionaceae bacterium]|nr:radical SAM family heme chaperone HemW [Cellvibrionaceae bacterium]HMW72099.1 radical SAM family heme chaperone HemW [Cellvibrionaceae bacterium]HNG59387.1 radical SAM family heme chaperone HemW [Cellvibrionaceae bacterium]